MTKLSHVLLVFSLAVVAGERNASESTLVYRTDSLMTSAVGYDTESDSVVELVQLGSYGPSVLRRVSGTGQPGSVIWRTKGETLCPGACGVGLEFSTKLGGYVVTVNVGTSRYQTGRVYFVPREGEQRLLARSVIEPTPDYPDEDKLEAGVVGFRQMNSVMLAADGTHILVDGMRDGAREPRTYALEVGKARVMEILEGRVLGVTAHGYLVSAGTKGWKTAHAESAPETESSLARTPMITISDKGVQRVVQAGDQRAEWRTNGGLFIYNAGDLAVSLNTKAAGAAPEKAVRFEGCATDKPMVTGLWATKHGTFMVAVDCAFNKEEHGRLVYGGLAHCLYEIQ